MIIFRLSGEHEELPLEEVKALYEAYGKSPKLSLDGKLLLAEEDLAPKTLERLAFTHEFFAVNKAAEIKNLEALLAGLKIKKPKSFCVRCLGFQSNANQERKAGEMLFERWKSKVNLRKPEITLHLIKFKEKVLLSLRKYTIESFEKRDTNDRPFFHPLALNPKLARLFLNLARLKEGDSILDPFCGSGSVLIEARLMGLKAIGSDLDVEMLWGCAKNLAFYGLKAEIGESDATDIKQKNLDAIVSDPPYARASKVYSENLAVLYKGFLLSASKALKPGGHLVFAVPHDTKINYKAAGFEKLGDHTLYVHKSLTRRVYILRKPK